MERTLTLNLDLTQMRAAARRQASLCPEAQAVKLGTRREVNRKHAAKLGRVKHKARAWD